MKEFSASLVTMRSCSRHISVGKDAEEVGFSYIIVGTVKWCKHFGKQFGHFFKKLTYDQVIPLLGLNTQEERKYRCLQRHAHKHS